MNKFISLFTNAIYGTTLRFYITSTCILIAISSVALADTTWIGTSDTSWNNAGNWNNGIPGTSDVAEITDTTKDYTINYDTQMTADYFGQMILTNAAPYTTTLNINALGFISKGAAHPIQTSNTTVVVNEGGYLEYNSLNNTSLEVAGEFIVNGGEAVWTNANSTILTGSDSSITVNSGIFTTVASGGGLPQYKTLHITGGSSLNIYGGIVNLTDGVHVGYQSTGEGTLTMTNGVLNISELRDSALNVGAGNREGTFIFSGGIITNYGAISVGVDAYQGTGGQIEMSGGVWNQLGGDVIIGELRGTDSGISLTGGTFNTVAKTILGNSKTGASYDAAYGHLTIDGGTYNAVDSVNNDTVLDVRRGLLTLSSGMLAVDQLVATNSSNSDITFDAGIMSVQNMTIIDNTETFSVGDGASSAILELVGGTHSYADGIEINTNATLAAGGTNETGSATINGDLTLAENSILDFDFSAATNDFLMVNGTVTLPTQVNLVVRSLDNSKRSPILVLEATSLVGDTSTWEDTIVNGSVYAVTKSGNQLWLELIPQGTVFIIN